MLKAVPCQVSNIRTNNGIQFSNNSQSQIAIYSRSTRFAMICESPTHNAMGSAWKRAKRLIIIRI